MTDALFWLVLTAVMTVLFAVPYVMERILRVGLLAAAGYSRESGTGGFEQPSEAPAVWAKRAYCAHRNAIESFAIFAALVLVAHLTNTDGVAVALAAQVYFFARLAHYVVYVLGIPLLRTLAFFVGLGAILYIAYLLLV